MTVLALLIVASMAFQGRGDSISIINESILTATGSEFRRTESWHYGQAGTNMNGISNTGTSSGSPRLTMPTSPTSPPIH